jgi:hypothetical protein
MKSADFIVARDDLQQCKLIETQLPDAAALPDEALLVKIDRFAFTANNITYAVLGDQLKYWQLFPAPENFGNIPVWGFGEVIASKHPGVLKGERLFGYFPMATHLVIEAADVSKRSLRDAAAHRQGVAPVYNAYARVSGDPAFAGRQGRRSSRRERILRRPQRDALQRLQQDRVRACASVAHTAQGYPRDRIDLGGERRFCQIARLLRRRGDL